MEEIRSAPYVNEEDRISRLPDTLIHHIMSFNDTKYAVQTSVLSRRWIDVWKSLPSLNFDDGSFSEDKKHSFIMFVDMVFLFRKDFDIQKFSFRWAQSANDNRVTTDVNRWSLAAVKSNVQEIDIRIGQCHNSAYEIPHRLLNCKSLRKLLMLVSGYSTRYIDIILPRSMSLPQLKELRLRGLSISNVESSKRLFSSCPVLEMLDIFDCNIQTDNQRNLIVDSLSLKKFSYGHCWTHFSPRNDPMASNIKLCAPNLEVFNCISFLAQDYSLENCSPLSRVCFCMSPFENEESYATLSSEGKNVYAKRLMKFLRTVYVVKEMILTPGFLEVLSQAPHLLDCQPPCLCNLQCLLLQVWLTRSSLRAVAYLLKIAPNITKIILVSKESNLAGVEDDGEAGLSLPLSHLKLVQIFDAEGCDAELKILRFLLENGKVLEKVAIFFRSTIGFPDRARQVRQFQDRLRAVATASSSIQMVFKT